MQIFFKKLIQLMTSPIPLLFLLSYPMLNVLTDAGIIQFVKSQFKRFQIKRHINDFFFCQAEILGELSKINEDEGARFEEFSDEAIVEHVLSERKGEEEAESDEEELREMKL